jgi:hypothetical protein
MVSQAVSLMRKRGRGTDLCPFMQALSPAGRCRTFDAAGDGYGRGEGFAAAVLARVGELEAEESAIVMGSATNQGGRSSGLTAPHGPSQTRLIVHALKVAGVEPSTMGYVAVHGTGKHLSIPSSHTEIAPSGWTDLMLLNFLHLILSCAAPSRSSFSQVLEHVMMVSQSGVAHGSAVTMSMLLQYPTDKA